MFQNCEKTKVAPNVLISMEDRFFRKTKNQKTNPRENKLNNHGLLPVKNSHVLDNSGHHKVFEGTSRKI